jgi:hypothetical protein
MPTALPRTQVTQTADLKNALSVAARAWPNDANKTSVLITRLALEGAKRIEDAEAERLEKRKQGFRSAGRFSGLFPPGYLDEIREGWEE